MPEMFLRLQSFRSPAYTFHGNARLWWAWTIFAADASLAIPLASRKHMRVMRAGRRIASSTSDHSPAGTHRALSSLSTSIRFAKALCLRKDYTPSIVGRLRTQWPHNRRS